MYVYTYTHTHNTHTHKHTHTHTGAGILAALWSPAVVDEPIPRDFEFSPAPLHLLDGPNFGDNFGHFVVDQILSAFTAVENFGCEMEWASAQVRMYPNPKP